MSRRLRWPWQVDTDLGGANRQGIEETGREGVDRELTIGSAERGDAVASQWVGIGKVDTLTTHALGEGQLLLIRFFRPRLSKCTSCTMQTAFHSAQREIECMLKFHHKKNHTNIA